MTSDSPTQVNDPRLGACVYILHMLLQRVERQQPGCLDEMIAAVAADRDSARGQANLPQQTQEEVFETTLQMLRLANAQLKLDKPL